MKRWTSVVSENKGGCVKAGGGEGGVGEVNGAEGAGGSCV